MKDPKNQLTGHPAGVFVIDEVQSGLKTEQLTGFPSGELAKGIVPALNTGGYTRAMYAVRDAARQAGKVAALTAFSAHTEFADKPITDMVHNAPTPRAMLEAARAAGKTEAEINAFAASQPMTPVAIKGTRVFVQDCFGRTFGLDDVPESELAALVKKGVPYTPYSNRKVMRADARARRTPQPSYAESVLPKRETLREKQKKLSIDAAPIRSQLTPQLQNVLEQIERGVKVSRKEHAALAAYVALLKGVREG